MSLKELRYDEIGIWSEIKLQIIKEYASAYSQILAAQRNPYFYHFYIDGFAGTGEHFSSRLQDYVPGSPLHALRLPVPFKEYHFIELDHQKANNLKELAEKETAKNVTVHEGDCNKILIEEILPQIDRKMFRRALCLLDPYGLHLDWRVIALAGRLGTVEIFLNFPIMDMNMNVLKHDKTKVDPKQIERMNRFWGDESWREVAYPKIQGLFETTEQKVGNPEIVTAFRKRLKEVAGFKFVPEPIPMKNDQGPVVYYLFYASPNKTGPKIVKDIFDKYRARGLH